MRQTEFSQEEREKKERKKERKKRCINVHIYVSGLFSNTVSTAQVM
jgi:hypothetical protein